MVIRSADFRDEQNLKVLFVIISWINFAWSMVPRHDYVRMKELRNIFGFYYHPTFKEFPQFSLKASAGT
jgi:hypothetical protein